MGFKRREFLKSMAGVPFLGGLGYAFSKNSLVKDYTDIEYQNKLQAAGLDHSIPKNFIPSFQGKNDLIRIGIIGNGKRGKQLLRGLGFAHPEWISKNTINGKYNWQVEGFLNQDDLNIQIAGVTDTFDFYCREAIEISQNEIRPQNANRKLPPAKVYPTYREMLESDEIDAVVIASPDHWHARMAIDAVKSGKHVYLEKPMSQTVEEANELFDTLQNSDVIFQLGHQNRQQISYLKAKEFYEKGVLGNVSLVETYTNRNNDNGAWIRDIHPKASESNINWKEFLGNAPYEDFDLDRYFNWQKWFEYGTGPAGNQFTHSYDCINQVLNVGIPEKVTALGGLYYFDDPRNIPDLFNAIFEYPHQKLNITYDCTLKNSFPRDIFIMGEHASMQLSLSFELYCDSNSDKYRNLTRNFKEPFFIYNPRVEEVDAISSATSKSYYTSGFGFTFYNNKRIDCTYLHLREWVNSIRYAIPVSCDIHRGYEESITYLMANLSYLNNKTAYWDKEKREVIYERLK